MLKMEKKPNFSINKIINIYLTLTIDQGRSHRAYRMAHGVQTQEIVRLKRVALRSALSALPHGDSPQPGPASGPQAGPAFFNRGLVSLPSEVEFSRQ